MAARGWLGFLKPWGAAVPTQHGLTEAFYSRYVKALRKVDHWEKQVIMESLQQKLLDKKGYNSCWWLALRGGMGCWELTGATAEPPAGLPPQQQRYPRHHLAQGFLSPLICSLKGAAGILGKAQLKP